MRNWLIKRLAGRSTIILNADLKLAAPIHGKPRDFICGCALTLAS